MGSLLKRFWSNEAGQDLIEYTLLLAFVALMAAGLFIAVGQSVSGIWVTVNSQLSTALSASS